MHVCLFQTHNSAQFFDVIESITTHFQISRENTRIIALTRFHFAVTELRENQSILSWNRLNFNPIYT